jgi:purine nucleosidase
VTFPTLPEATRIARLEPPKGKVRMVLDTDTFNEVDDQFAIVQALLSPERLQVEAIYAAPFFNALASSPEDGMEKSYDEILAILGRMNVSSENFVFRGSRAYLVDDKTPQDSEAVRDFVKRAMSSGDEPLYVVAIGAPTNIASALLLEPRIIEKIVVVWLGGHALNWHTAREFNLQQDPTSVRVLLASGVPLVLIPCMGVTSHLTTTVSELEQYVAGRGEVGDFLVARFKTHENNKYGWAKEVWDMAAVAYLLNDAWTPSTLQPTTGLTEDLTWKLGHHTHVMRVAHFVNRNGIFADFFKKLETFKR